MKDGVEQQPSSIAIAETEQGDRHDPVTVIINGEPVAKGRPRMTRRGFVYTPAATRKFEVVEVYVRKKFSVAPKMIATIFPLDATPSNRRASR